MWAHSQGTVSSIEAIVALATTGGRVAGSMVIALDIETCIWRVQYTRARTLLLFTVVAVSTWVALAQSCICVTCAFAVTRKLVTAAQRAGAQRTILAVGMYCLENRGHSGGAAALA